MIFISWKNGVVKVKKKKIGYTPFMIPYLFILIVFILLPMLFIVIYSLVDKTAELPIYSFTFANYKHFLKQVYILSVF